MTNDDVFGSLEYFSRTRNHNAVFITVKIVMSWIAIANGLDLNASLFSCLFPRVLVDFQLRISMVFTWRAHFPSLPLGLSCVVCISYTLENKKNCVQYKKRKVKDNVFPQIKIIQWYYRPKPCLFSVIRKQKHCVLRSLSCNVYLDLKIA